MIKKIGAFFSRHFNKPTNQTVMGVCFLVTLTGFLLSVWSVETMIKDHNSYMNKELDQFEDHISWYLSAQPFTNK